MAVPKGLVILNYNLPALIVGALVEADSGCGSSFLAADQ